MFRGNIPTRVDEKGRIKLPADYKREIDERYGAQFFITSRDGKYAEVWPMQEWQKIEEKMALIPNSNPAKKKFLGRVNYYGQPVEMDAQGRLLIPQILREAAKLDGDSDVFGMQDHLEVMNHSTVKERLESDPWTDKDDQDISDLGW